MKLFYCKACQDIIKLTRHKRSCACKLSTGKYTSEVGVKVYGPCRVFAIADMDFRRALTATNHIVSTFMAFVLDNTCSAIVHYNGDPEVKNQTNKPRPKRP